MDLLHLRNRMLLINPEATVTIGFDLGDNMLLTWVYEDYFEGEVSHKETISLHATSRDFEHHMHKATRVIRHGRRKDGN